MADNKIQVLLEVDDRGTASLQRFGREVQAIGNTGRTSFGQVQQASAATATSLTTLGTAARAMGTALAAVGVAQFAKSAFDTAISLDSMNRALTAVYGSTTSASAEMEFLRATAARTGQDVYALVGSYTQLSASTKGTALEGENTRKVFASISEAAAVLGLSNETTGRAFTALSQMASKGTISMEELRGQLGEALPGALNLFAKGMGIGTGELIELISQGKVGAAELTKFADAVHEAYGAAAETAALESGQGAVNRLSQAWTEFKANVVDVSAIVSAINFVAGSLQGLSTALNRAKQQAADEVAGMAGEMDATRVQMWTRQLEIAEEKIAKINSIPIDIQSQDDRDRLVELNSEVGKLKTGLDIVGGSKAAVKEVMDGFDTGYQSVQTLNGAFGETPPILDSVSESAIGVAEAYGKQDAALGSLAPRVNDAIFAGEKLSLAELDLSRKTDDAAKSKDKAAAASGRATTAKRTLTKASVDAGKAAKDLAKEQERLAKETETAGRAMIKAAAKRRELTAELDKALFDTSDAYETLGLTSKKAYEDQVKALTDAYQRILSIEELTDSERLRLREALQKGLIELEDDYRGKVDETAGAITQIWTDLTDETKEVLHDWVENAIKLEFDNVGEAFESLAKAMLDVWIDMIAKMIAEWIGSGLLGLFTGQGLGGFGAAGGSLIGKGFEKLFGGGTVGSLADWGLTAAGTSSVIGGASSLLGGGAGSAAFDWGLNSFGAPALGGGAAAGAATLFGEQAAAGFVGSLDTAMAGGLEWAAIPGKEFFGTGASQTAAAGGAGMGMAGAAAGALALWGGIALGINKLGSTPTQQAVEWDQLNNYGDWGRDQGSFRSDQRPGWEISGSGDAEMQSWGTIDSTASKYGFDVLEGEILSFVEAAKQSLADLTDTMGQQWADLAAGLENSVPAYDAYLDAIMGVDVAMEQSAEIHRLAQQAAADNGASLVHLTNALKAMGMSDEMARASAVALVAAVDQQQAASQSAASAAQSMAAAVADFSNTPLNIRVNVGVREQPYQIDNSNPYAIEHAVGGIFSSPTLIPSVRGTRHLVGEAGAEAIAPLHAGPKTLQLMHDDIKAIAARPVAVTINLDGRQIASATMPFVDAHVAAKASRNQLANRTVY